jgi:hypothetical protein
MRLKISLLTGQERRERGIRRTRFIVSLLVMVLAASAYATDFTHDANCVGAWYMNGGTGGTQLDQSGNGNDLLTPSGGYPYAIRSKSVPTGYSSLGRSCNFSEQYGWFERARIAESTLDHPELISIVAWIYVTTAPASTVSSHIAGKWAAANEYQFLLRIIGTGSTQFKNCGLCGCG